VLFDTLPHSRVAVSNLLVHALTALSVSGACREQ
jgi:hypothetical protein